jgi:hypothetical protein
MRKVGFTALLFATFILSGVVAAQTATPKVFSEKDREFALKYASDTRDDYVKQLTGLSDAQLNFRAAEGRWTMDDRRTYNRRRERLAGNGRGWFEGACSGVQGRVPDPGCFGDSFDHQPATKVSGTGTGPSERSLENDIGSSRQLRYHETGINRLHEKQ